MLENHRIALEGELFLLLRCGLIAVCQARVRLFWRCRLGNTALALYEMIGTRSCPCICWFWANGRGVSTVFPSKDIVMPIGGFIHLKLKRLDALIRTGIRRNSGPSWFSCSRSVKSEKSRRMLKRCWGNLSSLDAMIQKAWSSFRFSST